MSRLFKIFDTHTEYEAFINQGITDWPNVSVCKDNYEVHFNDNGTITPTGDTHEYVEIAGIKWATMNIGANSVTDVGLLFQWGDSQGYTAEQVGSGEGQKYFGWADYKYGNGSTFSKYNGTDGKTVLELSDDGVRAAWGGNWRMPTTEEWQALGAAVNTAWTTNYQESNVAGLVCTDKTDSSKVLFLPAAGYALEGEVYSFGDYGYYLSNYWSSSLYDGDVSSVFCLNFSIEDVYWDYTYYRCYGFPVRGVLVGWAL